MKSDDDFYEKKYENLGEIDSTIEKMESSIPDKRTKDFDIWKDKINFLFDLYNKSGKFKAYKKYE